MLSQASSLCGSYSQNHFIVWDGGWGSSHHICVLDTTFLEERKMKGSVLLKEGFLEVIYNTYAYIYLAERPKKHYPQNQQKFNDLDFIKIEMLLSAKE